LIKLKTDIYKYLIENKISENHWWFRARNNIINEVLEVFLNNKNEKDINILDIGSGLGQLFPIWKKFGNVYGIEKNENFAELSKKKYPYVKIYNGKFPSRNLISLKFDIICLCDFLEHISNTNLILKEVNKILNNNGLLLITVPAYSWMWSRIDIKSKHFRRYSRRKLINEVEKLKFKSIYSSYFMTFLFPSALIIRKIVNPLINHNKEIVDLEYAKEGFLNQILYFIFDLEKFFIRRKIILPFGLSVLGLFKKKMSN